MPRARNTKIWNEDLVKALRAREEQCRQQGTQRQFVWRDGAAMIEAVRADIYQYQSSKRFVNLPKKLTKTVEEECRAIIEGRRPILPEGYIPTTLEEQQQMMIEGANPYRHDPYLKRIKMRGGAYAILMAFHFSLSSTMTKEQITAAAQPHCDEEMESNYHAGRPYGAWCSKKTLLSHGLITEQRTRGGYRGAGAVSTFALADNGKKFLEAMLEKFPQADPSRKSGPEHTSTSDSNKLSVPTTIQGKTQPYFDTSQGLTKPPLPVQVSPLDDQLSDKRNKFFHQDKIELLSWIKEGSANRQKKFRVGASRREHLHTLCDDLMERVPDLQLQRKTVGQGTACTLYVTIRSVPTNMSDASRSLFAISPEPKVVAPTTSYLSPISKRVSAEQRTGWTSSSTPPKRLRPSTHSIEVKRDIRRSLFAKGGTSVECVWSSDSSDDELFSSTSGNKKSQWEDTGRNKMDTSKAVVVNNSTSQQHRAFDDGSNNTARTKSHKSDINTDDEEQYHNSFPGLLGRSPARGKRTQMIEWPSSSDESENETMNFRTSFVRRKLPAEKKSLKANEVIQDETVNMQNPHPAKVGGGSSQHPVVIDLVDSDSDDDSATVALLDGGRIFSVPKPQPSNVSCKVKISPNDPSGLPSDFTPTKTNHINVDSHLVVLIDNRERNRNATPRQMRMELLRHLTSGSLKSIWPVDLPLGDVEEECLNYGDFSFVLRDGIGDAYRFPISIERKRIGDLVQRSTDGDHWRQIQRMRDCCEQAIVLIEGDTRNACHFTAYGSQQLEDDKCNPNRHTIDDELSLYRFIGRAILSSPRIKFLQTKDEQSSYRAIGSVGLVAVQHEKWNKEAPFNVTTSKVEINRLYNKLRDRGVPWQLARRVAEEVGSVSQLEEIYANCSPSCRKGVLAPLIENIVSTPLENEGWKSLSEFGSTDGWSAAIYGAFHSTLDNPTAVRSQFEEYKSFVEDQAKLLRGLHAGSRPHEIARTADFSATATATATTTTVTRQRKVRVSGSETLLAALDGGGSQSFVELRPTNDCKGEILTVVFETTSGRYKSDRLHLHVLDATHIVKDVVDAGRSDETSNFMDSVRRIARKIQDSCFSASDGFIPRNDRQVLLVKGLTAALDASAKRPGYQSEQKILVDLILATLMIRHNIVVLHAQRLSGDVEMIIRQLAMSCYHYQLLTQHA